MAVATQASPQGTWALHTRPPAPALRGFVGDYQGYSERTGGPLRRFEVPHPDVTLIIGLGPPLEMLDPNRPDLPGEWRRTFVAGLHAGPALMEHAGEQYGIEVRLPPPAARMLMGLPLSELADRVVDLEDVLGPEGRYLPERLAQTQSWAARFDILDAALARRMADALAPRADMVRAWQRLRASDGRLETGELAAELGCSRRHLARRFREEVGLAPKTFARVLRFGRVTRRLRGTEPGRLSEIAQECGYYDQAHLNRDFRDFAGLTPGQYTARLMDGGLGGVSGD